MSEKIVQLNEEVIKGQIKELVRGSVEETLNELLEAEAEKLTQAARYERNEQRQGYRSGHYSRNLTRESGENPERYRRCMRRVPYPLMKISHWETGKAGYAGAGAMLPIREPEDLQKEKHFAIF